MEKLRRKWIVVCFYLFNPAVFANNFDELTITQLHQGVSSGQFTYAAVTQHYLSQIERLNPDLRAVIAVNPHALRDAKNKDTLFLQGKRNGTLFGVPVLLKDNIDTDFLPTTAGALALAEHLPSHNALVVEHLIRQGAIILGKANLSEWANFKSTRGVSGYSAIGGQTQNPYRSGYSPCGSSSGSAVAVAANMALVAIGTETDGSIHCPAAMNSVVGFKPSISDVSQQGIIPIAHSQDTAGPLVRTVADAELVYYAMKGEVAEPKQTSLKNKRIGLLTDLYGFNQLNQAKFTQVITQLKQAGVVVVEPLAFVQLEQLYQAEFEVLLFEFKQGINQYLSTTSQQVQVKSLDDLIKFNSERGDERQELLIMASNGPDEASYIKAKSYIDGKVKVQLDALFKLHNLDAIVAPTVGPAWKIDPENGDQFTGSITSLAAVTGFPSIALPIGSHQDMPIAISLIAAAGQDSELLALAKEVELLVGERLQPALKLTEPATEH